MAKGAADRSKVYLKGSKGPVALGQAYSTAMHGQGANPCFSVERALLDPLVAIRSSVARNGTIVDVITLPRVYRLRGSALISFADWMVELSRVEPSSGRKAKGCDFQGGPRDAARRERLNGAAWDGVRRV